MSDDDEKHLPRTLEDCGIVLTSAEMLAQLPRAFCRDDQIEMIIDRLTGNHQNRALLLGGSAGVGKTAIIHEVAHRLAERKWTLVEVSPSQFLVGTKYLGEWESRTNAIITLVQEQTQAILYIPNFDDLMVVGRSASRTTSVSDFLAPLMMRGELAVLGEASSSSTEVSSQCRRVMQLIEINPLSRERSIDVSLQVAASAHRVVSSSTAQRLLELADYCNTQQELPGRSLSLLRRAIDLTPEKKEIEEADLLQVVEEATGVPTHMLDDRVVINRQELNDFFQSRVMGQREAIDAAADLVMLIKSGLNDPQKPFSTMLFVGPTGVGKTELARAIAQYCMGDPNRLVRIDMSEYVNREAVFRLLGSANHPGALTDPIREHPFSIILLDEFEKANYAIFDLCLQLFDAGRLTDLNNRTVDFCRTVIILTSNLGSQINTAPQNMGFRSASANDVSPEEQLRDSAQAELARVFRPEFLNRLDRIVHFAPLDRITLEMITRRELERALDRRGIHRRKIDVQIDPSILPVLVEKGYTTAFGARPLKRTIERLVLVPLARQIATGKLPAGSTVMLTLKGGKIKPKVLELGEKQDPEPEQAGPPSTPAQRSSAQFLQLLQPSLRELRELVSPLKNEKSKLVHNINTMSGTSSNEKRSLYDQLHRTETILARWERFQSRLQRIIERTNSALGPTPAHFSPEVLSGLELESRILRTLLEKNQEPVYGADVVVTVRLLESRGERLFVVEKLARMIQNFLARLDFSLLVLDDQLETKPLVDQVTFLVHGPGPYMVLKQESGLHVFRKNTADLIRREVAQIEVMPLSSPYSTTTFAKECSIELRRSTSGAGRFGKRAVQAELFHHKSQVALSATLGGDPRQAHDLLLPWLAALAQRQLARSAGEEPEERSHTIIRRYDLGIKSLIRDTQSGLRWGQPDRLLGGWLDRFVLLDDPVPKSPPQETRARQ